MKALLILPIAMMALATTMGQIVASLAAFMFCAAFLHNRKGTYQILMWGSLVNAAVHFPLATIPDWSMYWPATFSVIDLVVFSAILYFGSTHKYWQATLLGIFVLLHMGIVVVMHQGLGQVFYDWYYGLAILITLLQIAGGFYDIIRYGLAHTADYLRNKCRLLSHSRHKSV